MTMHRRSSALGSVVLSINMNGGAICVDFFERDDGSFGFEEYRRDVETAEGWFPIGFYCGTLFDTLDDAKAAAVANIGWLGAQS